MKKLIISLLTLLLAGHVSLCAQQVLGHWLMKKDAPLTDISGRKHTLKLRGKAEIVPDDRFGIAMKSTGSRPETDNAQGALAGNNADFTPQGAFSFDLWVNPDSAIHDGGNIMFLLDKKVYHYHKEFEKAHLGYLFYLAKAGATDEYTLTVGLGFKTDTVNLTSRSIALPVGEWHHVAFSYDGEGTVRIFKDDECVASKHYENRGAVAPSPYQLILGDRSSSNYNSFIGKIAAIRYCSGLAPEYAGSPMIAFGNGRTVFLHTEADAQTTLTINNDHAQPLTGIKLAVEVNGQKREVTTADMAGHEIRKVQIPVRTDLKAGDYTLKAVLTASQNGQPVRLQDASVYDIVNRQNPFMPVVMWGTGDIERLTSVGFTHDLRYALGNNYSEVWKAGKPLDLSTVVDKSSMFKQLNGLMKAGLHSCLTTRPGPWIAGAVDKPEYKRVKRDGSPADTQNVAVAHPDIQQYGYNIGASSIMTFGQFPYYDAALIHSEVRDNTALSFHPYEVASAEAYLGCKIPELAKAKNGVPYQAIKDFPVNRVIPDDDTLLRFYRWFWKDGDGWNPLHSRVHDGLKSTGRKDFWTFFDPAVRVPSLWGSGGHVDIVSQWTYSYPDPLKIGQSCDELFAMAEGQPGQQVMKMTQIIWYRSGTAPMDKMPADEAKRVPWEREIPDAKFISIAPDHLSIALWSMIARPVRGIMYHGWGSLFKSPHGSYRMTNPKTAERLTALIHEVIQPLGATLLQVPDVNGRMAILESFASQMYAQCGSSGWSNGWEADMHLICQWAGYQPRIVYDETICKNGLKDYDVLVMPNCYVLTKAVYDEIRAFQARGGIVVADERLCPAVMPDILLPAYARTKAADKDKAALQKMALQLRQELEPFFTRPFKTTTPDLAARLRATEKADYLFVINDARTYGDYVGQYGLVMERGLDTTGGVWLKGRGYIYDLVAHKPVAATAKDGGLSFDASFGPGEGKLFLRTDDELKDIAVTVPAKAACGTTFPLKVVVNSARGGVAGAVLPMELRITDADGKEAEFSGYHAAKDGVLTVDIALAANETPGTWTVTARDLASGNTTKKTMSITK